MLQLGDKMTSVPSVEKNDVFVNRRGAHSHNIEIEGTGVDMRWLSKKLPGVIFFRQHRSQICLVFHQNKHSRRSLPCKFLGVTYVDSASVPFVLFVALGWRRLSGMAA